MSSDAQTKKRVCLVDLDLQFGEVSTALHLRPKFTISNLLSREDVDDDDLARLDAVALPGIRNFQSRLWQHG